MKKVIYSALGFFAPAAAFAQSYNFDGSWFDSLITFVQTTINTLFPIATGIMVLVFFYEVYRFIKAPAEKKPDARTGLIWSIVGLFLVFAIFGIIGLLLRITGTGNQNIVNSSTLPIINFDE